MIIPVYKPLGASTHQLAQTVGEHFGEKATHTGTLDPLAEGVVIVLTGPDRFRNSELSDWRKTYQFTVLFGVSTDSHDLLGLPTAVCQTAPRVAVIENHLPAILSKLQAATTQVTPAFSAKRFQGA